MSQSGTLNGYINKRRIYFYFPAPVYTMQEETHINGKKDCETMKRQSRHIRFLALLLSVSLLLGMLPATVLAAGQLPLEQERFRSNVHERT